MHAFYLEIPILLAQGKNQKYKLKINIKYVLYIPSTL